MNNKAENLEWVTRSENDLHDYKNHLRKAYPCKFKKKIVAYDLKTQKIIKGYENTQECCEDLKVARSNIYNCCNGKQKNCKGYGLRHK